MHKNLYPFAFTRFDKSDNCLVQANYDSCLEIGELFLYCAHLDCVAPVNIEAFKNMNPLVWAILEQAVAEHNFKRLVGETVSA